MDAAKEIFGNISDRIMGDSSSKKTTQNKKMGALTAKAQASGPTQPEKKPTWADFPYLFAKNLVKMSVGAIVVIAAFAALTAIAAVLGLAASAAAMIAMPFVLGYALYLIGDAVLRKCSG